MPSTRTNDLPASGLARQADLGRFYVATNPTVGTGIAQSIVTAFSATDGLLTLRNGALGSSTRRLFPAYLKLIPTVIPASATRSELAITVDDITRYSSGGSAITVTKGPNMAVTDTTAGIVHFGALTLAAAGANVRLVSRSQLRAAIPVAFEEYLIDFTGLGTTGTLGGTAPVRNIYSAPPVILGSGQSMQVHVWHPSNAATAASWEFELGYYER